MSMHDADLRRSLALVVALLDLPDAGFEQHLTQVHHLVGMALLKQHPSRSRTSL